MEQPSEITNKPSRDYLRLLLYVFCGLMGTVTVFWHTWLGLAGMTAAFALFCWWRYGRKS